MTGVRLTARGKKIVLLLLIVGIFTFIFFDLIGFSICVFLVGIFTYDYLKIHNTLEQAESLVNIDPESMEATLTAGDVFTEELEIENLSDLSIDLELSMDNAILTTNDIGDGTNVVDFFFSPNLAGKYRLEGVETIFDGSFGLIRGSSKIPLKLLFNVQPRVIAAAVRAARFLAASRGFGEGDQPLEIEGPGLEYSGSREYQPGDELRHIDWKATARLNKPIVKEFYMEGGGGIHLLYDAEAPDPVSRDKLSASFLNVTLAAAQKSVPLGISVQTGDRLVLNESKIDSRRAVSMALKYSLETAAVDVEEFYSVLEPATSREVRSLVEKVGTDSSKKALLESRKNTSQKQSGIIGGMRNTIESSGNNLQIGIISTLSGDISPFLELEDYARQKGAQLSILQPTKPWKHGNNLETSYKIYEKSSRSQRVFQKRKIPIDTTLEKFLKTLTNRRTEIQNPIR